MAANFTPVTNHLSTTKTVIAAQAAIVATAATAVAALDASAVGQETDAARRQRLDDLFNSVIGAMAAAASVLNGFAEDHRRILRADLFDVKGQL